MSRYLSGLRLSVRRLLARPASTLVAIVTLSAGIGAVSTMYVLFEAGMDDLPPVPDAERIGRVFISSPQQRDGRIPPIPVERLAWVQAPPAGVTLAVAVESQAFIEPGGQEVHALRISRSYFDVARVHPESGRIFAPGEAGIVVSRRLWDQLPRQVRRLGATLTVNGEARALVGVMSASFWMPVRGVDAWIAGDRQSDDGWPQVLVRLGEDVTADEAAARLSPVVQHVRGRDYAAQVRMLAADAAVRARTGVLMLVGPALLVLLTVCANVSALLLADVHRRRQELAVRAALGASRWRLAGEVISDALVIAALGGIVSLAGAFWSVRALRTAIAPVSPDFAAMMPTFHAVWPIALATAIFAVLGVGYAPALLASRVNIVRDLAGGGPPLFRRGRYTGADLLLVLQIAMATGLVLWTAIFANIFNRVAAIPSHVPADRIWTIAVSAAPGAPRITRDATSLILEQAAQAPGIEAAGLSESAAARRLWSGNAANNTKTTCSAWLTRIAGDYFTTHRFPVRGSAPDAGEAILNEPAVSRCGAPVAVEDRSARADSFRVIGSVDDRLIGGGIPDGPFGPATVYTRLTEPAGRQLTLKVRSRSRSVSDVRALRDRLARSVPAARFAEPVSFEAEHRRGFSAQALFGKLLFVLAGLSLLFGIVGLHAAIAQALTSRTREIGVSIALGAEPRHLVRMTVGHHAAPALIGVALGTAVAIGGLLMLGTDDARLIRQLAWVTAQSPGTWAALLGLLLASSLVSAAKPVVRALHIDPSVMLRRE